jgi:fermentation-respiration switch protein FrsA (DUF1100 family)
MRTLLACLCLLLGGCTGLIFQPMKPLVRTPQQIGLAYQDVYFPSRDGTLLHGWFLPAQGASKGTIVQLHGNAENISTHIGSVYWLPAQGYNVFLFDYRGYGLSAGTPSLDGAIMDVESAIHWLLDNDRIDPQRIVVLGQSLGGALGTYALATSGLASRIRALVLDSTFGDYRRIAREKFAALWLTWPLQYPLSWSIDDDYAPIRVIARISPTPVLIIHSEADAIIPVHHARQLYAAAKQPKQLWLIPDGHHISALNRPAIRDRLLHYLGRILDEKP